MCGGADWEDTNCPYPTRPKNVTTPPPTRTQRAPRRQDMELDPGHESLRLTEAHAATAILASTSVYRFLFEMGPRLGYTAILSSEKRPMNLHRLHVTASELRCMRVCATKQCAFSGVTAPWTTKAYLGLAGAVQANVHRDRRLVGFPALCIVGRSSTRRCPSETQPLRAQPAQHSTRMRVHDTRYT